MNGNAGPKVVILYKISNIKGEDGAYNAFELPVRSSGGVSLSTVKDKCLALRILSSAGPSGYHWRVRVDDKPNPNSTSKTVNYSWWDIQDDSAKLPVRHVGFTELQTLLADQTQRSRGGSGADLSSQGAKGVVGKLGKAMNKVAATVEGSQTPSSTFDGAPKVPILMFKLLDLVKLDKEYSQTSSTSTGRHGGGTSSVPNGYHASQPQPVAQPHPAHSQPTRQPQPAATQRPQVHQQKAAQPPATAPVGSLMDFGPGPTSQPRPAPSSYNAPSANGTKPNETRAQKLKREYEKKKQTENRVWDEIDQRWVTVQPSQKGTSTKQGSTSAPPGVPSASTPSVNETTKKVKGISLDAANTIGKSANVAAAVQTRVNEMQQNQAKAVQQIRDREEAKKKAESEEDVVRQRLEPKIKAWSEEHGKKKQLRALLASLHTILWPDAKWKQVNLGDLLDDKKCRLAYHKASRVVHPDKTMKLPAEQRFLAKRIFDALSQAKTEFDNSK